MLSLLCVSHCTVPLGEWSAAVTDIQLVSAARNSMLDITGLLIATPGWFAQLLEGSPENVDSVVMSILADMRHCDMRIVRRKMIERPRCSTWRVVRFEQGSFEAMHVRPLLEKAHQNSGSDALIPLDRLIDHILLGEGESSFRPV